MSIRSAKLNKTEVVNVYSKNAPVYDLWGWMTETKARQRSLALANISDGEAVLEVAIGTGLTFREILNANPNGRNVGVDITPAMLERARMKAEKSGTANYDISIGDAYDLQFADNQFDVIVNNYMFDLLPEQDFLPVLEEFRRVLKPDGRIILVNMTKGEHLYQRFWELVYRINPKLMGGCRGVLLARAMSDVGFKNIYRETVSQFGFPSEIITASA